MIVTAPDPIGHGGQETARTVKSRKTRFCQEERCGSPMIYPGEDYVRAVTFPRHDIVSGQLTVWVFCVRCATRYGRPLPPRRTR